MHRIFLGLAITCGTLMAVAFALGLGAVGEAGSIHHDWHDLHWIFGLLAVLMGLLVHSIVFTYFLGTGKWVKEVVRVYGLPDWVHAQAIKNKRKAFPFELASMFLLLGTATLGAGTDTRGWPGLWHLAAAALTLAFNLGAFTAEYAAILAQARLLVEVKDEADRLREAQLAQAGLPRDEGSAGASLSRTDPV